MKQSVLEHSLGKIRSQQATIDMLLREGSIIMTTLAAQVMRKETHHRWTVQTIHASKECTLGIATCDGTDGVFPEHVHDKVDEFLICVKGSFIEHFGEGGSIGMRIVREKECVAVPAGMAHSSKPLEPGTMMAFVCVPHDHGFCSEDMNCGDG